MKKLLVVGGIALLSVGLAACGNDSSADAEKDGNKSVESVKNTSESSKVTFKNDVVTQENGSKIKFTGSELMADFEGKPMLVILFDYTNNGKKGQDLQFAYLDSIGAKQNLGDTTEDLEMGIPDANFKYQDRADKLNAEVNPGSTVQGAYYYEVKDKTKPVILEIHDSLMNKVGEKEYKVTQ